MNLTSVTYTSLARPDLQPADVEAIHEVACERNLRDNITGLLIFNGTHFLQVFEGTDAAVGALIDRLQADTRHSGFEVRDRRKIEVRSFPDWSMELLLVKTSFFEARETIAQRLPDGVPDAIQARLFRMTELISKLEFPS